MSTKTLCTINKQTDGGNGCAATPPSFPLTALIKKFTSLYLTAVATPAWSISESLI